jgi:hypothetical protein
MYKVPFNVGLKQADNYHSMKDIHLLTLNEFCPPESCGSRADKCG